MPRSGARIGSPTPSRTRCADILADRRRGARRRRALRLVARTAFRVPAAAAAAAERADRVVQAGGRYVQAVHVLGELRHTIACDITRARVELGYEPEVGLFDGMRASRSGGASSEVSHSDGSPRS